MGKASKARRLRDRAQRRVGVDARNRATYPADQWYGSSRRLRQAVFAWHRFRGGQGSIWPGRWPTPTPTARANAGGTDGSVAGHRERRRPRISVAVTSTAGSSVEGGRAAPICVSVVGALRRSPQPVARRMAMRRSPRGARASAHFHSGRGVGVRKSGIAGTRADGPLG